jgi:hypothetical protein
MKTIGAAVLVLFLGGASAFGATPEARGGGTRTAASAEIASRARTLLETQAAAWNRGDLEAFCSVYAEDALFLTAFGLTKGRAEVLARYRARYPDAAPRDALVRGPLGRPPRGRRRRRGDRGRRPLDDLAPDRPAATGLTLLNLLRSGAGWKIVHDASM